MFFLYEILNKQKVYYDESCESFYTMPFVESDFSVLVKGDYTCLDIQGETLKVVGVNGFCGKSTWRKKEISLPEYKDGEVYVDNLNCEAGCGEEYSFTFKSYFSEGIYCLCQQYYVESKCIHVRCMENVIMAISDKELQAIWVILEDE